MPHTRSQIDIDEVIRAELAAYLAVSGRVGASIHPAERLAEGLGITSFELADLVARLNGKLAADPFRATLALTEVQTVDDLCRAYRGELAGSPATEAADLDSTLRRAQLRRARRTR